MAGETYRSCCGTRSDHPHMLICDGGSSRADMAGRVVSEAEYEAAVTGDDSGIQRTFSTGAVRDTAHDKPQYEGYLSPLVLARYGEYMLKNQERPDGNRRASDNWQQGIPLAVYADSEWRHHMDFWLNARGYAGREDMESALCGLLFNSMGYLHEILKTRGYLTDGEKEPA